jgi:FkbM family methyltransferase
MNRASDVQLNLDDLLAELAVEPLEEVEARASGAFDRIAAPCQNRAVIFGTGHLGRLAFAGLSTAGVEPMAYCDNNPRLWNSQIDGVPVLSPAAAAGLYFDSAAFVTAIYNSTAPQNQLRQLGCSRIVPYPTLFWKHWRTMPSEDRLDLPHRILARAAEMAPGYAVLSDDKSRHEFCARIRWRCLLDYSCLRQPDPAAEMYFPPDLFRLLAGEVLVDCGAFDGDSIRAFLDLAGGRFDHIYAFEADSRNLATLERYCAGLALDIAARITVLPYAVGRQNGTLRFCAEGSVGSKVVDSGPAIEVRCRSLDSALACTSPTFIKMDIEGAELEALAGGREIMGRCRPVMAVCAYHKCDHLWIIPQLLKTANPDYHIFLRRYAEDCWETVYYAVPAERLAVDNNARN